MDTRVVPNALNRIVGVFGGGHNGIDIGYSSTESNNNVLAHSAGTVIVAIDGKDRYPYNNNSEATWGNYVKIDHGNGYYTLYAHLKKGTVKVSKGQKVAMNTIVGIIGESGYVTARHLHFEVYKNNNRIDPKPYLTKDFDGTATTIVKYQSHDNKYGWNPNVNVGSSDYAGNYGVHIDAIYLDKYRMRVHDLIQNEWLPWVQNRNDYAGNLGHAIDGVQIEGVEYRIHDWTTNSWGPWITKVDNTNNGFAGTYGHPIDALQIKFK